MGSQLAQVTAVDRSAVADPARVEAEHGVLLGYYLGQLARHQLLDP
jgi:hypothetical protein